MRSQFYLALLALLALVGIAAVATDSVPIGSDVAELERLALGVAGLAAIGFVSRRRRRD